MRTPLPTSSIAATSIGFKEGQIAILIVTHDESKKQTMLEFKVDPLVLASLGARIAQILGAYCEQSKEPTELTPGESLQPSKNGHPLFYPV